MIYQRDEEEPDNISNFNMVLKGTWSLNSDENAEDFIYKRIGLPQNEDLLTKLYCEDPDDRLAIPDLSLKDDFNPTVNQQLIERFLTAQGQFQGYFKYNGEETTEKFSFIFKKSRSATSGYVKKNTFEVGGYGENDLGPFTLEGLITLIAPDKIQEREGLKNIKKVKVAKFELKKTYKKQVLEELVEELESDVVYY